MSHAAIQGRLRTSAPAGGPLVYDPVDGRIFAGPSGSNDVAVLNASSGQPFTTLHVGVCANDGVLDAVFAAPLVVVFAGGDNGVTVFNASSLKVVANYIQVGYGPRAITYDSHDQRVFVATQYDKRIWVINASNNSLAGPAIPLYSSPIALLYDRGTNRVYVTVNDRRVLALNGTTEGWDPAVNWSVGGGPYSMALVPGRNWLYVANHVTSNVTVINASSGATVASGIGVSSHAEGLVYYPPTDSVIVSTASNGVPVYRICEINVSTNTVTANATVAPYAVDMVYDSLNGKVYIDAGMGAGVYFGQYIAVLDPRVSLATQDIQVEYTLLPSVYDPRDQNIYVIDPTGPNGTGGFTGVNWTPMGASSVLVVNGSTREFQSYSYSVGTDAEAIAYDAADGRLYVANQAADTVSVIDPANRSVGTINMTSGFRPIAVAVDSLRNIVYVAGVGGGNLTLINGTTETIMPSSIYVGTAPGNYSLALAYDPESDKVFVGNCGTDNVTIVNASSRTVVTTVGTGSCPDDFAVNPMNGSVWVSNGGSDNVTVLNGSTGRPLGSVWVGYFPDSIVYDPANGLMYVSIALSDNVTPIDPATLHLVGHGIWLYAGGPSNLGPLGMSYDPVTQEVDVPTVDGNAMFTIGNVPGPVLAVSSNRTDIQVPVEFFTNVTGGTAPFRYNYTGLPAGCSTQNSSTLYCWPLSAGNYTVEVSVQDARNFTAQSQVVLQVFAPPTATGLAIQPTTTDADLPVTFTVNASSGVPPLAVTYQGLPPGCGNATLLQFTCRPSSPGLYTVTAVVADAIGSSRRVAQSLQVVARPTVSGFVALPDLFVLGQTTSLLVEVQGGIAPYSYAYSNLPDGCSSANVSELSCAPMSPGDFRVGVTVADAEGVTANATTVLTVYGKSPPPIPPPPAVELFLATPSEVTLGNSTTFMLLVNGGMSPVTENFTGLPSSCTEANGTVVQFTCTPGIAGNYSVTVTVRDAMGREANGTTSLAVEATVRSVPPPTAAPTPWSTAALSAGIGGVAGLGLALAVSWMWRRRSRPRQPELREFL